MTTTWKIRNSILVLALNERCSDGLQVALSEAMDSTQFRPGASLLFDARLVTENPGSERLRCFSDWILKRRSEGFSARVALVIAPKLHHYGLARMVATLAELKGLTIEIFFDVDQAERWLSANSMSGGQSDGW